MLIKAPSSAEFYETITAVSSLVFHFICQKRNKLLQRKDSPYTEFTAYNYTVFMSRKLFQRLRLSEAWHPSLFIKKLIPVLSHNSSWRTEEEQGIRVLTIYFIPPGPPRCCFHTGEECFV